MFDRIESGSGVGGAIAATVRVVAASYDTTIAWLKRADPLTPARP